MKNAYEVWTDARKTPTYWAETAKLNFAVELNSHMEEQKISGADLAKRISVSRAYISKILGGYANFTIESMSKLAFALGYKLQVTFHKLETKGQTLESTEGTPSAGYEWIGELPEPSSMRQDYFNHYRKTGNSG